MSIKRRDFLSLLAAAGATNLVPADVLAQQSMPRRRIPSTGEMLPIIGLGSSKAVAEIVESGPGPLTAVLRALVQHGGKVVDTWPRRAENDERFGRVISEPDLRNALFITCKIDRPGKQAGIDQFRETQRLYGRQTIDLVQVFSLTDVYTHWPSLQQWKKEGAARYIGVTVAEDHLYGDLGGFLQKASPDFMQVNYSLSERASEKRMLPMAASKGVAVLVNRPFMNGVYFDQLKDVRLPEWTQEFDCHSWAQFSLKYILANPAVTGVLTETTNPQHMAENAMASYGTLPNEAQRQRMAALIDSLVIKRQ